MENQHKKIIGYRDLNKNEIDLINAIKCQGQQIGHLIKEMRLHVEIIGSEIDPDWINIGETDLKKGIMALVRAVAKPDGF